MSEKTVEKAIHEMNRKKSAGTDGLSQDKLIMAKNILKIPLTRLINHSIEEGEFPNSWKEALITPILKKGDRTKKENYRPISCLSVASKVLEKIVCDQITNYMEKNNLFPETQHGFRKNRSTMSALAAMQQEWIENTEAKEKTGILLWDLTAAYDTIDAELLVRKLELYGFSEVTLRWFKSFLIERTQRVKIGMKISTPVKLVSGMPQGGILSPVLFIIFVADMEDWTENSGVFTYADDTSTDASSKQIEEVMRRLEKNAEGVLNYMASNGLVANPGKTVFMVIGQKQEEKLTVKVGDTMIPQTSSSRLLGMDVDDDLKWKTHVHKLVVTLDRRLFQLRRLSGQISSEAMKKVSDSLWTSKMRYGLQLIAEVRTSENQTKRTDINHIQKAQNRMLRTITKTRRLDKIKIKDLLERTNNLSVNQTAAQIKLVEMWKAAKTENYPVRMEMIQRNKNDIQTRNNQGMKFKELMRTSLRKNSFVGDGARLWNNAPVNLTNCNSIESAKREIRKYCKTLPI